MTSKQFLTNSYIPKKIKKEKYKWFEHNLMTYFDDFKYDEFVSDGDGYFANVQVINLDIIHQACRGSLLQNPENYYKTIRNQDFKNYEQNVKEKAVPTAIKTERDDIHVEHSVLENYLQGKTMVESALLSIGFFLKKKKKIQLILQN